MQGIKFYVLLWHLRASQGPKGKTVSSLALARYAPHPVGKGPHPSSSSIRPTLLYLVLNLLGFRALPVHKSIQANQFYPLVRTRGTSLSCYYKACLA